MNKIINKTVLIALAVVTASSCIGKFEEYNTEPYALRVEDPSVLIAPMFEPLMYAQQNSSQYVDQMVGTLGGYFALNSRWSGQNFDTFNPSDEWSAIPYNKSFNTIYANYFKIEKITEGRGHYYAMAKLIKAASMVRVVDLYGPIPYSCVQDGDMTVAYDSAEDVYKHIIDDLKSSAEVLSDFVASAPGYKPLGSSDPIYGGDYSLWAKFAESIIMRVAMRTGNKEAFVDAMNSPIGYIQSNSENAMRDPKSMGNPYNIAGSIWNELRPSSSIVSYTVGYNDPRADKWFTPASATWSKYGKYVGLRRGNEILPAGDGYRSKLTFNHEDLLPVFVAAESQFLLAEAALKGWIQGDARTYYEEGVKRSFEQWGVSGADAYLADETSVPGDHKEALASQNYDRKTEVKIAWDAESTPEKHLEQIITQKWIANYPLGLEAWADYRRTGYPELAPSVSNLSSGVISDVVRGARRVRYPYQEKDLNSENYQKALSLLGGSDNEATDLFWAKK
ncbi:MAG: SusD/RagB family nutrient-binding outer membrane lipoprotein [Bacteroides uniformis]|nr:SusD/RagB family nutrient-binding outer membrane lipoprotein [Bacteroidaceae bacterium]MDY4600803.1 SusD/RagB family nutrient-binding outer membrane lipoprotein [Bacteroides uniformis]MDY4776927.1 SusD/RagB family nutrient-binding outer membrane lipoprotein [Phocaeicola vulgatus]